MLLHLPPRLVVVLLLACGFAGACEPAADVEIPDRGADLRGPVSPPPLHDLIAQNRQELGLSVSEERAIRQLADDARDELDGYHDLIGRRRDELSTLLREEEPDRAAVEGAIEALGSAETQLRSGELRVLLDIRARLSPEQREALVGLAAQADESPRRPRRPRPRGEPPPPRPPH